jgi:DNA-binding NarL/FixJ family response regulator
MRRVLLVEDHVAFAQAMKLVIGAGGDMRVIGTAHTLAEGREMLRNGETPDLVVVDLMLPDLPVVVLSAEKDLNAALAAGADEAINKDTPLPRIVSLLKRLA